MLGAGMSIGLPVGYRTRFLRLGCCVCRQLPIAHADLKQVGDSGSVELDLADQRPGHTVLAKLAQLHADNTAGDEDLTSWAAGFLGERLVGEHLGGLGDTWRVLHAVPLGRRGKDIDHLVLGPRGLFVINTKHSDLRPR
jgi:Nuclease-related domain